MEWVQAIKNTARRSMKRIQKKSPAPSRKPDRIRRRQLTTRSFWRTVLRFSRWRKRRPGRKFKKLRERLSRWCRSDSETRRIAREKISSESWESRKRRTDWWEINKRKKREKWRWIIKINRNNSNKWMKLIIWRFSPRRTTWWFVDRRRRRWWRTRRSRRW